MCFPFESLYAGRIWDDDFADWLCTASMLGVRFFQITSTRK
jgi:hypothetical protein